MNKKLNVEDWINETMLSLNTAEKQEAPPFLLTRLHAKLKKAETPGMWGKLMLFLCRPANVLAILLVILAVNGYIIFSNLRSNQPTAVTTNYRDDFSSTLVSVYDYENVEP